MSTFLELCQQTALEASLIGNTSGLVSVSNQSGILGMTVSWVQEAWTDVQREKNYWNFQHGTFTATLTGSVKTYDATSLGVTRLNRWVVDQPVWLHDKAIGTTDETELIFMDYKHFHASFSFGDAATLTGRPQYYTVEPDNELSFHPIPDQGYGVRGTYYKSAQTLTDNADIPDMPEDYHSIIKYGALLKYAGYDEATTQTQYWSQQRRSVHGDLVRDQLPKFKMGGALA